MQSNGSGVVFTDSDINMARRIAGLMNKSKYELGTVEIVQAAQAITWFQSELFKHMEDNVMEVTKVIDPKKDDAPAAKTKGGK